jgi:glyoxylase-like metal-dependent hydrolase (beta-lactamase superfamily II)
MLTDLRGWNVIDAESAVLWREYQFNKGAYATTLVFRGTDGLVVVSPGKGLEAADYDVLSEFGEVRALIANNAFHHLGQGPWRARFPKAESYVAPQALATLRKKAASIPFRSLDELSLPPTVKIHVLPGFKNGDVLVSVGTRQGSLWYTGDLLTNIQRTPGPPLSWLFSWTDSAPGFRLFKLGVWFFVNDKRALKERMNALLAEDPPALIVPGHGPAVMTDQLAAEARVQIAKL